MIGLIGTTLIGEPIEKHTVEQFTHIQFSRGKRQNNSIGVSLFLSNTKFDPEKNICIRSPRTTQAKGRIGLCRNQNKDIDFAFFPAYFPPRPRSKTSKEYVAYKKNCLDCGNC